MVASLPEFDVRPGDGSVDGPRAWVRYLDPISGYWSEWMEYSDFMERTEDLPQLKAIRMEASIRIRMQEKERKAKSGNDDPEKCREVRTGLTVRVLADVPTFAGPQGDSYSLREGDVLDLPKPVAKALIRRGKAVVA